MTLNDNYIASAGQTYVPFSENIHVKFPAFDPPAKPEPPLPELTLTAEAVGKGYVLPSQKQHFLPGVTEEMMDWFWANMEKFFTTKRLYLVSTVRLLVIPLVTVLVFMLFPVSTPIRMTMLIAGAAPVGANVAVYSQLYDTDYGYACQTVTQSTLFSIVTMPVIIWIAERLF